MNLASVLTEPLSAPELRSRLAERQRRCRRGPGPAERAAVLRRLAPPVAERILAQAEEHRQGLIVLPGSGRKPVPVGTPPRWHENITGDDESTWVLNRMPHWPVLLRAYALTGERRFAAQVVAELADWIEKCPCPPITTDVGEAHRTFFKRTPWRSLDAGLRLFEAWPWIGAYLADDELLTPDLVARFAVSLHEHAEVMARICPMFYPRADHNHYLMENLGLLSITVMMPELAGAARWQAHALRELERCAVAQLTEDGGQVEGCPSYHNGCVSMFCQALRLSIQAGAPLSPAYRARLRRALDYSLHSLRPTGVGVPWGDSDATDGATLASVWWREAGGDPEPMRAVLPLVGPERARTVVLDRFWWTVQDPEALLAEVAQPSVTTLPLVNWQRELSQVALRTDWSREALSVFFACRSPVNNGHAHLDTGGFDFCALGRSLIPDPGRYTYREGRERYDFKRAAWHSTVTVDGRDPFSYLTSWDFGEQREGRIVNVWERPGLLAAAAFQRNFAPALHRRLVAVIEGRVLATLDDFDDLAPASAVQRWFHIDSTEVRWDAAKRRADALCGEVALQVYDAALTGLTSGSCQPGRISELYDSWRESTRLCLEDPGPGPASRAYAALLLPYRRGTPPPTVGLSLARIPDGLRLTVSLDNRSRVLNWTAAGVTLTA